MVGAGTLSLLLALSASPREGNTAQDYAQFKQAQDDYVTAWVKGNYEKIEPYFSPKFVFMRQETMMSRSDFLGRLKGQFLARVQCAGGESTFRSVVPEVNGYSITVKRHYHSVPALMWAGEAVLHNFSESKESWILQAGRWMLSSVKSIARKSEWHTKSGEVIDVTFGRRTG